MLDKAHQPSAPRPCATRRATTRGWRSRAALAAAMVATASATALGLAADAGAAGPVEGALGAVTRVAAEPPSTVAQVLPSAAAQQAGDVAPAPSPVAQALGRTTSTVSSAADGNLGTGAPQRNASAGGASTREPESTARRAEGAHGSTARGSRDVSRGSASGSGAAAATAPASERRAGPLERLTRSAAHTTKRARVNPAHVARALDGARRPSAQLPEVLGTGALVRAARQLTPSPAVLGEASRAIDGVGETATQLIDATPQTIATLLAPLTSATLPLPSLLSLPLPSVPSLPILTLGPPAPPQQPALIQPRALWPAVSPVRVDEGAAANVGQQFASPPSSAGPAIATAASTANEAAANPALPPSPTHGRPAQRSAAAEATEMVSPLSLAAASGPVATAAAARATSPTAPLRSDPQPAPAPSPGGLSAATGAGAGPSIPILLTLAGMLLLAAPCTRRVLRLLGESWRLSPLLLIPERPG